VLRLLDREGSVDLVDYLYANPVSRPLHLDKIPQSDAGRMNLVKSEHIGLGVTVAADKPHVRGAPAGKELCDQMLKDVPWKLLKISFALSKVLQEFRCQ
jgi:hypothetical protein